MSEKKSELKRQLSPAHVWALAFGCVVGWGSFINPGKKFLPNSGVAGTAIAMALGALVTAMPIWFQSIHRQAESLLLQRPALENCPHIFVDGSWLPPI